MDKVRSYIRFQLSLLRHMDKPEVFDSLSEDFSTSTLGADISTGAPFLTNPVKPDDRKKRIYISTLSKDIRTKIKTDVQILCAKNKNVSEIYYFCEVSIPTSIKNALEKWCRGSNSVQLEILDGPRLAERLCDPCHFWIALKHLDIPCEMYPKGRNVHETYLNFKKIWLGNGKIPASTEDFFQIKYGLRSSLVIGTTETNDLPRWVARMTEFIGRTPEHSLNRKALFEVSSASISPRSGMKPDRRLIEDYFTPETEPTLSDLQDRTALLYRLAENLPANGLDNETIARWKESVTCAIDERLRQRHTSGIRCLLLQMRGHASLIRSNGKTDKNEALCFWKTLLDEVDRVPQYPIEDFSDLICSLTRSMGCEQTFFELGSRVDNLIAKKYDSHAAATRCRDRAMQYHQAKSYLSAIKVLHQARIRWSTDDTSFGSAFNMLMLADCYQRLGLCHASRYYAAGATLCAQNKSDQNMRTIYTEGLFSLAESYFRTGEWITYLFIVQWVLAAHNMYTKNAYSIEEHVNLKSTLDNSVFIRTATWLSKKELLPEVDRIISLWPVNREFRLKLKELSDFHEVSPDMMIRDTIRISINEELVSPLFSDTGKIRSIEFKALGISWSICFENNYTTIGIAEELATTLQVMLADLSGNELCLLPTSIRIDCHVFDVGDISIEECPCSRGSALRIGFPRKSRGSTTSNAQTRKILSVAAGILEQCSLLENGKFRAILKKAFSEGLSAKVLNIDRYSEIYSRFMPIDRAFEKKRKSYNPIDLLGYYPEHEDLAWNDSPGPGYSKDKAKKILENRYRKILAPIRLSLEKLLEYDSFRQTISKLRAKGYLDWHILMIIAAIAVDFRAENLLDKNAGAQGYIEMIGKLINREETKEDIPVPPEIFSDESLAGHRNVLLTLCANAWGLDLHCDSPDFEALEKLLVKRYRLLTDDADHPEYFPGIE